EKICVWKILKTSFNWKQKKFYCCWKEAKNFCFFKKAEADSTAAIGRVQNRYYNDKSKPIRRKHNNVRSYLTNGTINVDYVKSCDNLTGPLTKALTSTSKEMGLKPINH
ncbi:hypothetical protein MTR67_027282, partial [Solanum verrucosum]